MMTNPRLGFREKRQWEFRYYRNFRKSVGVPPSAQSMRLKEVLKSIRVHSVEPNVDSPNAGLSH
jgi:hypothetical protein